MFGRLGANNDTGATASRPRARPADDSTIKRLIVCSDGTWQTLETEIPTNVRYLTMAIEHEDAEGVQQVLMYDAGIGTANAIDRQLGGALGEGIDINVIELYTFLALNYQAGDEVYMFGFSRGAYTVRSLAGLIHESGLVRRDKLDHVKEATTPRATPPKASARATATAFRSSFWPSGIRMFVALSRPLCVMFSVLSS
jgi:uncharacterized protein (DUF2235 family)